jgi:hypothetical protein
MSDFLARLVERARGSVPVLRPALPSQFAPGPALTEIETPTLEEPEPETILEERTSPPTRSVPKEPQPRLSSPIAVPAAGSNPDVLTRHHESDEAAAAVVGAQHAAPSRSPILRTGSEPLVANSSGIPAETSPPGPLSSEAGEGGRRQSGIAKSSVIPAKAVVNRSPSPASLERGPGGEVSEGIPPPIFQPTSTLGADRIERGSEPTLDEAFPARRPARAKREVPPPKTVRPWVSTPRGRQRLQAAVAEALEARGIVPRPREDGEPFVLDSVREEASGAEPTIHVTIGRVVVNTAAPVQPPKRTARKLMAPQLTLGEYLRRRREGRR